MLTASALLWIVQAAGLQTAGDTPLDKQVQSALVEIEDYVAVEPPIFAVDTRLKTAKLLKNKYPKLSGRWIEASIAASAATSDLFRVRIVQQLVSLDWAEAVRVARSIIGRRARADAFDSLAGYTISSNLARTVEVVESGLATGAFGIGCVPRLLELLNKHDPGHAQELFTAIMAAFPLDDATPDDISLMFDSVGESRIVSRALVTQAVEKVLQAVTAKDFHEDPHRTRKKLWIGGRESEPLDFREETLLRVAAYLRAFDMHLYARNAHFFERWQGELKLSHSPDYVSDVDSALPGGNAFEDFPSGGKAEGLSVADALEKARGLDRPQDRVYTLIEISRRLDMAPAQQANIAAEALQMMPQIQDSDVRLICLSMLSNDSWHNGERSLALSAASALSEEFKGRCRCEESACDSLDGREDCADLIRLFADYLGQNEIKPEDLALEDPSLNAAMALVSLAKLLGEQVN